MVWLSWIWNNPVGRALGAAALVLLAVVGIYRSGKSAGEEEQNERAITADRARADEIEERANEVRERQRVDDRSATERLRALGALRHEPPNNEE